MRTIVFVFLSLSLSILTIRGDNPSDSLREEPPVLSRGLTTALQWLVPKTSAGWADDWITKAKKQKIGDVVARVLYFDSHTTTYRVVILKDGSAYSWREIWGRGFQNSFEYQFSKEELKGLSKAFSETRLANLDGAASAGKDAVLLSLETDPLSPFVVPIAELPLGIRGKLGKLLGFPAEEPKRKLTDL